MRRRLGLAAIPLLVALSSLASGPVLAREWPVAFGGDDFRSGFNPDETTPYFGLGRPALQPNPEWITKLSDFPSGVFPMSGIIVAEDKVILGGASTNSIVALDQATGLPVWRFQPDPRGSKYLPGDGYAGGYPGTNAPWYHDGVLYATFTNGTLYAIDAGTGERIWRWEVPAAGVPGEVTDHVIPADVKWDVHNPEHLKYPLRAEVRPFTGDYPKFHSAVRYCDGKVLVLTLDSRAFAVDSSTGSLIWHRYVGAPDWPGEFHWPEAAQGGITPESGRSTRRFEAQSGVGCPGDYAIVGGEDGFLKLFDNDTGRFIRAYDAQHPGDLAFAHDIGGGIRDPESGDLIINTLSNRMIRLSLPGLEPRWRHAEDGGTISICEERADRSTCQVLVTTEAGRQDGPMGGAVFGGDLAIDPQRRIIFNPNQDGHLYIWKDIDVTGQNPTLVAKVPTGKNPLSKRQPAPDSVSFYLPDDGKSPPWRNRTAVLSSPAVGGGVAYFSASWEHAYYGVQYLDSSGRLLERPRKVFRYEVQWDDEFHYPPFGDTYARPIVDIDQITFGGPALADGHLYFMSNDGNVYSFDLHDPSADTQRNLAILGSGVVPFLPAWSDPRGSFDRVWTPADWYKNQVAPTEGWRLPTAGLLAPLGLPVAVFGFWLRRRARRTGRRTLARTTHGGRTGRWEGAGWP